MSTVLAIPMTSRNRKILIATWAPMLLAILVIEDAASSVAVENECVEKDAGLLFRDAAASTEVASK